jgi:hypothetical protein
LEVWTGGAGAEIGLGGDFVPQFAVGG